MAVEKNALTKSLIMSINIGIDPISGKDIIRSRNYGNINLSASDQDVYDVAVALNGLSEELMEQVTTNTVDVLINL